MPPTESDRELRDGPAPSMLDLVRLSSEPLFPPGGQDLYRQIGLLTDMSPEEEILDVGCGTGVTLEYFVREWQVHGSGVDPDGWQIQRAEERVRDAGLADRLHLQEAPLDALPYRDEIFDVVLGELGLAGRADPAEVVREMVRVAKPEGRLVLVQLVWKAPVDSQRRSVLTRHLGARPLMLVEWKRLLREAGVQELHTEDWSDEDTAFRPTVTKPFPDFAELFSLGEKLAILRRAWSRWGWRGVRTAVTRELEVHRVLTRERILGLDLVLGRKDGPHPQAGSPAGENAHPQTPEDP